MTQQTPNSVQKLESEIVAKGLTAARVTPDTINNKIDYVEYNYNPSAIKMECIITMKSGFKFVGNNMIVSDKNYNEEMAKRLAYEDAYRQIWVPEAYMLREELKAAEAAAAGYESSNQAEFVLSIFKDLLKHDFAKNPIHHGDILKDYPQKAFTFGPREILDNKEKPMLTYGGIAPQLLPYSAIINTAGTHVMTYRRKGKEEGLIGNRSLGVGGHIDLSDLFDENGNQRFLSDVIAHSSRRELIEEIGLYVDLEVLRNSASDLAIYHPVEKTSTVHIAIVSKFVAAIDLLTPNPDEFLEVEWVPMNELRAYAVNQAHLGHGFETWSQLLIDSGYFD